MGEPGRVRAWWASLGPRSIRKVAVAALGGSVLLVGIVMIFMPGPAFIVIPAGLAILATEFAWPRRLLRNAKQRARNMLSRRPGTRSDKDGPN